MKILQNNTNPNVIPLNFIYNDVEDVLHVIYKDLTLNKKFVENIEKPKVPIWIIKKQYRGQTGKDAKFDCSYNHDFLPKELCDYYEMSYKYKSLELARILGCHPSEVNSSVYVAFSDMDITNIYFIEFLREYPVDPAKYIPTVAFSDIETDVSKTNEMVVNGQMPITVIVYIDPAANAIYQLAMINPEYGRMDYAVSHVNEIIENYHNLFDAAYGSFNYHIHFFNSEVELLKAYWYIIRNLDPDFLFFWNAPFDVQNIDQRAETLGATSVELMKDPAFGEYQHIKKVIFEDKNHIVHRRKHIFELPIKTIIQCQMVLYAGIRAPRGKIPSMSLNAIADKELKQSKVSYSEEGGSLTKLLHADFVKYMLYNLNDSLLQLGIENKVKDCRAMYSNMYTYALKANEMFIATTMESHNLNLMCFEDNLLLANNRNKNKKATRIEIELGYTSESTNEDDYYENDNSDNDDDLSDEDIDDIMRMEELSNEKLDKIIRNIDEKHLVVNDDGTRRKFSGAIVNGSAKVCKEGTGYTITGKPNKYVHRNVIDEDIESEYPTGIKITNLSNDTFVGKIILDDESQIPIPFYSQYYFSYDDKNTYKVNPAALVLETIAQGDYMIGCELGFGLPSYDELCEILKEEGLI